MKKISLLLVTILVLTVIVGCGMGANASSSYIETEGLSIEGFFDNDNTELNERQSIAHMMAECARALGYPEDSTIIKTAQAEWKSAQDEKELKAENFRIWSKKYEEYPYATYVWLYLTRTLGYNDYVAAGIIGNMMAEVGGGTLNLQYWLYSYGSGYYYGLCQWNKSNYSEVRGCDLIEQCEFLAITIEYELDTFGYAYSRGYKYADFLALNSTEDAALMFAKCYERCASNSYGLRQTYAETAYQYFTGLC